MENNRGLVHLYFNLGAKSLGIQAKLCFYAVTLYARITNSTDQSNQIHKLHYIYNIKLLGTFPQTAYLALNPYPYLR